MAFHAVVWADDADGSSVRDHTSQEARSRHRAGVEAFAVGRYDEAIAAFLTADALHPSSASAFNIAKAYEAKGDEARALSFYREYLRRSPRATDRAFVNGKVAKLAKRVAARGLQQVTFLATPQGAAVLVDSEPIGAAPITLEVPPGKHDVEFRKAGFLPARFTFELVPDRPLEVIAKLAHVREHEASVVQREDASAPSPANTAQLAVERPGSSGRRTSVTRTLGFAALGASVAALGGAVTLEVMRSNAESDARQQTDQVAFSEAYERMKSRQTMARVFAASGGALAALGGVLLVVAQGESERASKDGMAFGCMPTKCQAAYKGTF